MPLIASSRSATVSIPASARVVSCSGVGRVSSLEAVARCSCGKNAVRTFSIPLVIGRARIGNTLCLLAI